MIEHITYNEGLKMLQECQRVLKPGEDTHFNAEFTGTLKPFKGEKRKPSSSIWTG